LLWHVGVQRQPSLLFEHPLLRQRANLLRLEVLRSWFDLLRQQHLLRLWGCML
jgi:hypothetical protein